MTILDAVKSISPNRLATYRERLNLQSDGDCLGMYIWNKKLCGVFLPVLQLLEVSLRNAIHLGYLEHQRKSLQADGKSEGEIEALVDRAWFKTFFENAKNDYAESWRQIEDAERKLVQLGRAGDIDQIIAKLSYGFWSHLCSNDHDETHPNSLQLWPKIREEVFPGAKRDGKDISLGEIRDLLFQINRMRNRIAHHEPIWHSKDVYDLPGFVNKLLEDFSKCLQVIGWINPSNLKTLTLMESAVEFAHLCKLETIADYREKGNTLPQVAPLDPQAWEAAGRLSDRYNGVVIKVGTTTVIKRLKNNTTFVLDTHGKFAHLAKALDLKLYENVNFVPARWQSGQKRETLLARHVVRGHLA
jgi:hypothetical protein